MDEEQAKAMMASLNSIHPGWQQNSAGWSPPSFPQGIPGMGPTPPLFPPLTAPLPKMEKVKKEEVRPSVYEQIAERCAFCYGVATTVSASLAALIEPIRMSFVGITAIFLAAVGIAELFRQNEVKKRQIESVRRAMKGD